jgi:hypothetical protein
MTEAAADVVQVLAYRKGRLESEPERAARFYLYLAWSYPLLPLIALYATWLTGWIVLGHAPRPSLDDPKDIGGPFPVAYVIAGLLLVSLPFGSIIGVVMGIFVTFWYVHSRRGSRWLAAVWTMLLLATYVTCVLLLKWDPLDVANWYLD